MLRRRSSGNPRTEVPARVPGTPDNTGVHHLDDSSGFIHQNSHYTAILICVSLIALALRLVDLDRRPMHGDEANQAYKAGILLETGRYVYDPHDHHGPTLYYLALLPAWLSGKSAFSETTEFTYRIVPVLFGAGILLLLVPLRKDLGGPAAIFSAVLLGISPALVFYSRYFIQETLLVFFTFAAILSAWRYLRRPSLPWALTTGISLSLMHATKETAILAYAAMAGALICVVILQCGPRGTIQLIRDRFVPRHFIISVLVALSLSIVLYTAFFTNPRGTLDSVLTYGNYLQRADGAGIHDKPWHYYLRLLAFTHRGPGPWWSEAFILAMACVGAGAAFRNTDSTGGDPHFLRFIAFYTIFMTALYSLIPYKTPWSMLSFFHGMVLLAGIGTAACFRAAPKPWLKAAVLLVFAAGCGHLGLQTYRSDFNYYADPRNPYVYAHTSTAMLKISKRAEEIAELHPDGKRMLIKIIQPDRDYWPLPWYLRTFERVGYWHELPEDADAVIIIADPSLRDGLESSLHDDYADEMGSLRPGVLRTVYIERSAWEAYLDTRR